MESITEAPTKKDEVSAANKRAQNFDSELLYSGVIKSNIIEERAPVPSMGTT